MAKIQPKNYPHNFFLAKDGEGKVRCFLDDPMKNGSMENETDLIREILAAVTKDEGVDASVSLANPVIIRFQYAHIVRSRPFSPEWVEAIRRGDEKKHFQDLTGATVDIIGTMNRSDYPYNGAVLSADGEVECIRTYNAKGECSDGEAGHTIAVMDDAGQE